MKDRVIMALLTPGFISRVQSKGIAGSLKSLC